MIQPWSPLAPDFHLPCPVEAEGLWDGLGLGQALFHLSLMFCLLIAAVFIGDLRFSWTLVG